MLYNMRFSVASWVPIPTSLPNEFLFENYFKLYEKAKQIGDSKLSATAKALKYALVLRWCWSHFDNGDNFGSLHYVLHYVYDLIQICHQHLLPPTSATNIDVATLYLSEVETPNYFTKLFLDTKKKLINNNEQWKRYKLLLVSMILIILLVGNVMKMQWQCTIFILHRNSFKKSIHFPWFLDWNEFK